MARDQGTGTREQGPGTREETEKLGKNVRFYEFTLMFGRKKSVISFYVRHPLGVTNAFHIAQSEHRDVRYLLPYRERETQ